MAKKQPFAGEILHFNAVRLRVTGSGNLELSLQSLDDVKNTQLADVAMSSTTNKEPTMLANFTDQRAQLVGQTVEYGDNFMISKIILYIKPVATSYPQ